MKIEKLEDLVKAAGGLATHLKATATHHDALATQHAATSEVHKAHSELAQAHADGLDDGDANKAYFGKTAAMHKALATHHAAKAALHKAQAESCQMAADSLGEDQKAAPAPTHKAADPAPAPVTTSTAPGSVEEMVSQTTQGLVKKSLEMLQSDPAVADEIRKMVLAGVQQALGSKVIPDGVRLALPNAPAPNSKLIGRDSKDIDFSKAVDAVRPELQTLVEVDN